MNENDSHGFSLFSMNQNTKITIFYLRISVWKAHNVTLCSKVLHGVMTLTWLTIRCFHITVLKDWRFIFSETSPLMCVSSVYLCVFHIESSNTLSIRTLFPVSTIKGHYWSKFIYWHVLLKCLLVFQNDLFHMVKFPVPFFL